MPTTYAIPNGRTVMDVSTWSGTGSYPATITNQYGFKPDLVWGKTRSTTYDHVVYDSVRGTGSTKSLATNITNAEGYNSAYTNISAFASNGFTVDTTSSTNILNNSGQTFVAWQWQAGQGTTSSNTAGSITSTVSVNQAAGFSIVKYTGTGANGTVGHGLGVAPSFIVAKNTATSSNWNCYHASIGANYAIYLNLNSAAGASSAYWNNTPPTSSVFSLGNTGETNASGNLIIAYCWAQVAGFSQFGTYTGNGSSDGPFIYTGFQPKFVMFKQTNSNEAWYMYDTARSPYNNLTNILIASLSNSESTNSYPLTVLSNGFKIPTSWGGVNTSGAPYIYMAFASNPFKYSNAF